ncbi:hypothetical protein Q8A73_016910 [Channa argus]|nr:hypothetical protein Q8A73_016907 [Channa argus]KAK2877940.1 hypothetical protein Q8A73_016910 [Channa argus]
METLPPMPAGGNAERARGPCCCYTLLWCAALFGQLSWLTKRNCKKTKTKGAYREAATKSAGVERRLHRSQRHCKARSMRGVNGASPFFSSRFKKSADLSTDTAALTFDKLTGLCQKAKPAKNGIYLIVPRRTTHHLRGTPFSACEAFQFPGSSHFPEVAPALWPSQSDCGQTKILPFPGGLANAQLLADLERGARKGDGQRGER